MQNSHESKPAALDEASGAVTVTTETSGGEEESYSGCPSPAESINELENGGVQITTTVGNGSNKRTQVMTMPLPPGTLPPRKRARTKDEKEQRRIERIMRNRQAAHASREKKRKHVEDLENRCKDLTSRSQELEDKLKQTQRCQMQTQEQFCILRSQLEQLEAAVQLAKTSGDLSVLDTLPTEVSASSTSLTTALPLAGSDVAVTDVKEECASPEALQLGLSAPSLSHSASNSPAVFDDELADFDGLDLSFNAGSQPNHLPFELVGDIASLDNSSKAHHPAAMMSLPLASQREHGVCAPTPFYLSRALLSS